MKVSKRESILLILLLTVGVGYLLYTFLYAPMLSNVAAATVNLMAKQAELDTYQQVVAQNSLDKLEADQQAKLAEIEKTAQPLLPHIDYSQITAFINQLARSQNILVSSVLFSPGELYDTAPAPAQTGGSLTYPLGQTAELFRSGASLTDISTTTNPAQTAPTADGSGNVAGTATVNRVPVDIELKEVTYAQILGFIKQLESTGRAIYLNNVTISAGEQGAGLTATLSYSFMQVEKLTDTDKGLIEVVPAQSTGKTDPFAP